MKRLICLLLTISMLLSVAVISAGAVRTAVTKDDGTHPNDAIEPASTGANVIKFDNSVTKWKGPIGFYIYDVETGSSLISWGSKKLNLTEEGGNIWSKDISDYGLESGKEYAVIFYDTDTWEYTYDLMMDTSCLGDTAEVTGQSIESPVDSGKTMREARWKNSSLGPRLRITSIGNVVGETCPSSVSKYDMFVDFLKNNLENARQYSGKDDQALIDDTASALGLDEDDVEKAIQEAGVYTDWHKGGSSGSNVIKFDNSVTKWKGPIGFYIYDVETGLDLIPWGSKKLKGVDEGGDIWSKDISNYGLESGREYAIIFYDSETWSQTYDLMMDTSCLGDTAEVTGSILENPVDSNKTSREARWKNSSLGPRLQITSIGNVVGETCPSSIDKPDMLVNFLKYDFGNARQYSGKDDQTLIDDIARALGLDADDVEKAIKEADVYTDWHKGGSSANGFTVSGTITSYLTDDLVTVTIRGIKEYFFVGTTTGTGRYQFGNIPNGKYLLSVFKKNHVTREYEITVNGNITQNATICPIGDANLNGKIQPNDAMKVYQCAQGKASAQLDDYAFQCADVNGNGKIQPNDAMKIYQQSQGKHSLF